MIAFIKGQLIEKFPQGVVLETAGLGYFIFVTSRTQAELEIKKEVKLLIYEHIKEDSHDCYGFLNQRAKQTFEYLLSVNGLGPKMALNLMEIASLVDLERAVALEDKKFLMTANGVGGKLAERIILELKDKFKPSIVADQNSDQSSAYEALLTLGLNATQASKALEKIDPGLDTKSQIEQALKEGKF